MYPCVISVHMYMYLCMNVCIYLSSIYLSISLSIFGVVETLESSAGYTPSFWNDFWSLSLYILLLLWFSVSCSSGISIVHMLKVCVSHVSQAVFCIFHIFYFPLIWTFSIDLSYGLLVLSSAVSNLSFNFFYLIVSKNQFLHFAFD